MSELQSTIEFSVELYKFYNVDLFQRGMYQVRCSLRVSSKLSVEVEVATPEVTAGLGSAIVLGNYGACRPFQILYRNEEVSLKDVVLFRCHMLVDGNNLKESLERAEFTLVLELWFSDSSPASMVLVSSRTLQLNMSPVEGLHYHLPVLFDYFHLSAVSLTIHAALTALHQPSMKRGILRYMQSCAPKSSKSWSKNRSTHSSSLTDPVLPVSSHKVYSKINESPQVHLEAYNVLLDSSNNLKTTIKEYKMLLLQREEIVSENYDTLVVKHNEYDSTKLMKKHPFLPTSCLAELCADNIRLWNYFLLTFSCKIAIQQFLSRTHHSLRTRRFAELFFLIYNPRSTAMGCYETNYHNYLVIAELTRRSKYLQTLPPLPVHCTLLDGESATMPIIFEDQYQDPFEYEKRNCEDAASKSKDPWVLFKKMKSVEDSNCSCGIGNLWDNKESSENTLVNVDIVGDPLSFTMPARHSKSLDHLQLCSMNKFHYSISSLLGNGNANNRLHFYKVETLKNVASEHNMRTHKKYLTNEFRTNGYSENTCNCFLNNYYSLNIDKKSKNYADSRSVNMEERFNIKNLGKAKQPNQSIARSLSQISTESVQNIFKSSSAQFSSPNRKKDEGAKTNSLILKGNERSIIRLNCSKKEVQENGFNRQENTKSNANVLKTKNQNENSKHFEIGSTSSSTDSLSFEMGKTGSSNEGVPSFRKVRSTSCLAEEFFPIFMSGTESLPIITPKIEEGLAYPETKYYSSSSSTTSEQSGWITSRSSSIPSSVDQTNPVKKFASSAIVTNIDNIRRKLLELSTESRVRNNKEKKIDENILKIKPSKLYLENENVNGHVKKSENQDDGFPLFKGCEQNSVTEDFALPPPKQFRDFESPSSSVTNGVNNEEDVNAIDNLLYHVVDTQTTLERKQCQFDVKFSNETEYQEFNFYKGNSESLKSFFKAKKEFKSQLNFPCILYSDLNTFASTVPYFNISDEFRIFSPEGMHLVICVHGLDGNSADLRLVKTYLEMGLPGAYLDFLMSERNQGDTFSDFDTMTDRLVSEILHYLDSSSMRPTRVSFVGHSLGNIIIRSALTRPQMKFLLPRLHTFLSLSGPHLGTLYNSSGLVNMGMWFMQKWKKSGSLLQLCMKDSTDPRQSFLYRLSQRSTLHHFKNILLCGSGQDRYVPLHSARIELCKEALKDTSDQGTTYREMVHNIMSPIIAEKELKLVRYDIHHALPNTANTLIGRAAHIAVLDSEIFIEKFMVVVGIKYFR